MAKIYLLFLFILSFANAQDFKKDTIQLNETILYDKSKFKLKRVGSDTKTKAVQIGLKVYIDLFKDSIPQFIKEIAIPLNAPKKEYTFQRLNFNFSESIKEDSIVLKVDLFTNKDGIPEKSLLNNRFEIVIKKEDQNDNIFTLDLRNYKIKSQGDFFIKVELLTKSDKPIYFSGALLAKCLYRAKDSDKWRKTPLGLTPSINADILIKK